MNISEFTSLLNTNSSISIEQTNAIEEILKNYPYFQAARMIHLKALKNQHSFKYNSALKVTAAHTTNRTVLFDYITADTLDNSNALEKQQEIINSKEVVDLEIVSNDVIEQSQLSVIHEDVEVEEGKEVDVKDVKKVEEELKIGKPLEFDLSEMYSFREWLQLTNVKPIEREKMEVVETDVNVEKNVLKEVKVEANNTTKKASPKQEKFDIIEQFIASKPKLKTDTKVENIDVSFESVVEDGMLMTETLARVYLEQKKYDKAIQAFKVLSLKYPEKSSFFADRIKAIKFLQKNNS
ncbi:hypothetical protein EGM88_03600 [Aureibaculum marinum]|uniref:Tetratricopeptide repeat protein n=1 Tax=Aureibaculum marinum TaxID=2487930 RepID=A0A3N4P4X8_9FLAO|nr:tetratricopeptide repeat protein [Aureibaculum marinum]RPD99640.1 hypothetical protein EGM88_03600 [Aureibaculum marinum]